ncbi:MAG: hypothetical protein Q9202_005642 [Teloschistes flavicans]
MYCRLSTIVALSTALLLEFAAPASASHSRFHRHQVSKHASPLSTRDAGLVEISISDLQSLRMEMTAFQDWMHAWINTADTSDPATNIAQLRLEFQAYDGWMTAWLDSTLSPTSSSPPPLPSSIPVTTTSASSNSLNSQSTASAYVQQVDTTTSSAAILESTTASIQEGILQSVSHPTTATTLIPVPSPATISSAAAAVDSPISTTKSVSAAAISNPSVVAHDAQPTVVASPPSSSSGSSNAGSSNRLAVYYGQSGATSQVSLAQMCQDENVDIVILAFLTTFFGAGGYPSLNFGAACGSPSSAMQAAGASGLLSCPTMENDIKTCQSLGKQVLLSLGGAEATTAFSSDSQVSDFATKLWNLFGGGKGESADMRPFGSAVLDGFDIDNEDHSTAFYSTFVSSLRNTMNADSSKKYYISAAPQCPRPDASIPLDAMQQMDYVFVQFYNNGDCNVGQAGFAASLKAWSQDLSAKGSGPKLFIGAPGCTACAGSGYLAGDQMAGVIDSAKAAGLPNFGGVMLWDGPESKINVAGGKDYLTVVKGAMS